MKTTALKRLARGGGLFTDGDWIESPYITEDGTRLIQTGNIGIGNYREKGGRFISHATFGSLNCTEVHPGDLLICRLADPVARSCLAPDLGVRMITSVDVAIMRPRDGAADNRFLNYWCSSRAHLDLGESIARGGTRQRISREQLGEMPVPVLPLAEQRAIADYLDTETARIDALIAKKRRMIELLEERWRSAVDDLTMTGSPVRIRHVTSLRTSGPRGWADFVGDHGEPFIRSANLQRDSIELRLAGLGRVAPPDTPEARRSSVESGDTVIGITGANTGWVGSADGDMAGGFVSQHVAILRPAGIVPAWLTFSLFAPRSQDELLGGQYGGTKTQLGLEDLAELTIHLPTPSIQTQRLAILTDLKAAHIQLVRGLKRQLDLLAERRQALITAAVTGELEIPGVAA